MSNLATSCYMLINEENVINCCLPVGKINVMIENDKLIHIINTKMPTFFDQDRNIVSKRVFVLCFFYDNMEKQFHNHFKHTTIIIYLEISYKEECQMIQKSFFLCVFLF